MQRSTHFLLALVLCLPLSASLAQVAEPDAKLVAAIIETTLTSVSGQIRQLAFDGDPGTYFASRENAGPSDHFTLVFDDPVAVNAITVTTGRPQAGGDGDMARDRLDAGTVEVSEDGKKFQLAGRFVDGAARLKRAGRIIKAVRIKPAADLKHPLVIREITLASTPEVSIFKYPVEFVVDVTDAPEMKEWADKVARICERSYPMINEELKSDGFKPPQLVRLTLRSSYKGIAMAGGSRITGSVSYFKRRPEDVGAMVHETAHIVQQYRVRGNPGWLVEGIADYVRFFKYEPGKLGRIDPRRARYDGSYRVTAAFLAYLVEKYDRDIVRKLNKIMREGEYREEMWKTLTRKSLKELDEEWRSTLKSRQSSQAPAPDLNLLSTQRNFPTVGFTSALWSSFPPAVDN
jgi:hypothetical protein